MFAQTIVATVVRKLSFQMSDIFIDLRTEALDDAEKEGLERLYQMMLALRQQKSIRESFEGEKK